MEGICSCADRLRCYFCDGVKWAWVRTVCFYSESIRTAVKRRSCHEQIPFGIFFLFPSPYLSCKPRIFLSRLTPGCHWWSACPQCSPPVSCAFERCQFFHVFGIWAGAIGYSPCFVAGWSDRWTSPISSTIIYIMKERNLKNRLEKLH